MEPRKWDHVQEVVYQNQLRAFKYTPSPAPHILEPEANAGVKPQAGVGSPGKFSVAATMEDKLYTRVCRAQRLNFAFKLSLC